MDSDTLKVVYFDPSKGERPIQDAQELRNLLTELRNNTSGPESIN